MNPIYHISDIQAQDTEIEAVVVLDVDHPLYQGHFPDQHLVPGVVMLDIVDTIIKKCFGSTYHYGDISVVKFVALWIPEYNASAQVFIKVNQQNEKSIKYSAQIRSNEVIIMKLRATSYER